MQLLHTLVAGCWAYKQWLERRDMKVSVCALAPCECMIIAALALDAYYGCLHGAAGCCLAQRLMLLHLQNEELHCMAACMVQHAALPCKSAPVVRFAT